MILYTGYAEGISEAQLAASGVRVLMRKPIEPAELRAKLTELLAAPPAAGGDPAPRRVAARTPTRGAKARAKTSPLKAARTKASPREAARTKTSPRRAASGTSARANARRR
ncbi:MAG: hypothetical protein R3357_14730 [Burkholderiales bacterium]|nr:hypothetical protein [Burkholderiales bacterium]